MQSRPYTKRQERAMVREVRLRELGYRNYPAYLQSAAWRDVRQRYRASDLPQVCMCGDPDVQLHHTTYERVGRELLEDLIPLCQPCHTQAHLLEAEGVIGLDLVGFYFDPERARLGKLLLAQLAAACPEGAELRRIKWDREDRIRAKAKAERGLSMRGPRPRGPKPIQARKLAYLTGANRSSIVREIPPPREVLGREAEPEQMHMRSFDP